MGICTNGKDEQHQNVCSIRDGSMLERQEVKFRGARARRSDAPNTLRGPSTGAYGQYVVRLSCCTTWASWEDTFMAME